MEQPPEIAAYLREREATKAELRGRLEELHAKALEAEMTPEALRAELAGVLHAYIGEAADSDAFRDSLDKLTEQYAEQRRLVGTVKALEALLDQLIRDLDA